MSSASIVSGNYFDVLGVRPALGRGFLAEEDRTPNSHPVVVFSDNFWQRRFAGDPSVVGRTVTLNGRAFTVIGVGPAGFRGSEPYLNIDAWVPMMMQSALRAAAIASARAGNSLARGDGEAETGRDASPARRRTSMCSRAISRAAQPDDEVRGRQAVSSCGGRRTTGGAAIAGDAWGFRWSVAAIVLLIACANVANLSAGARREPAARNGRSAWRWARAGARLVQQLLTESTLLALCRRHRRDRIRMLRRRISSSGSLPPAPLPIEIDPSIGRPVLALRGRVDDDQRVLFFGLMPALAGASSSVMSRARRSRRRR